MTVGERLARISEELAFLQADCGIGSKAWSLLGQASGEVEIAAGIVLVQEALLRPERVTTDA